jgi:hypothetical protein
MPTPSQNELQQRSDWHSCLLKGHEEKGNLFGLQIFNIIWSF